MSSVDSLGSILSRNWWLLLLRGIVAIGFGVLIFAQPQISLQVLVYLFGAYVLVDGVLGVWVAVQARNNVESWWLLLLWGLLGVAVGILAFARPETVARVLLYYIAIWAIATGVLEVVAAARLRQLIKDEWWLLLAGLASLAFGAWLIAQPDKGTLALLWLIGAYALVFGALVVILAFKIRSFVGRVTHA